MGSSSKRTTNSCFLVEIIQKIAICLSKKCEMAEGRVREENGKENIEMSPT